MINDKCELDENQPLFYCVDQNGEINGEYCSIDCFNAMHLGDSQYKMKSHNTFVETDSKDLHKLIQKKDLDLFKKQ